MRQSSGNGSAKSPAQKRPKSAPSEECGPPPESDTRRPKPTVRNFGRFSPSSKKGDGGGQRGSASATAGGAWNDTVGVKKITPRQDKVNLPAAAARKPRKSKTPHHPRHQRGCREPKAASPPSRVEAVHARGCDAPAAGVENNRSQSGDARARLARGVCGGCGREEKKS